MLTLKQINENTEQVVRGLEKKRFADAREAIDEVLAIDKRRRDAQQQLDGTRQEAKQLAARIGALMKEGRREEAETTKQEVAALKTKDRQLQEEMADAEQALTEQLCRIPNVPHESVPEGKDAADNEVLRQGGTVPQLSDDVLCHWDLCKKFGLIDFDLGVKVTGAGFPIYIGKMARL